MLPTVPISATTTFPTSAVMSLLELIGGIYIHGSSLTMKSGSLKYIQRTSKKKYK